MHSTREDAMIPTLDAILAATRLERRRDNSSSGEPWRGTGGWAAGCAVLVLVTVVTALDAVVAPRASEDGPPAKEPITAVTTDPPAPAWVRQMERDPLR
jgi:hypothetical protein